MWSSHSPDVLPPPRSRASWPSAESSAYPMASASITPTPSSQVGGTSASSAIPVNENSALIAVTAFGVRPRRKATAAK